MNITKSYRITCGNCKQSDIVIIQDDTYILWDKNVYIVSGRKRLDLQWGWQCMCGNNDIMTNQEKASITNHQQPDSKEISELLKVLKPQKPKFNMQPV